MSDSAASVDGLAARLRELGVMVKALTIGDDELVVLECPDKMTRIQAREIRDMWWAASGSERAVVTQGVRIAAARYEDVKEHDAGT